MREYVTVLRQYLWTGQAKLAGDFFTVDVAMPPAVRPPQTPLLLAALRSNAFRLAGELSDGAISWMCPVPYLVSTALPALSAGADAARRPRPPLVAHVPVALSQDREAVHVAARARLGLYGHLPFYARMFADAGLPPTAEGMLTDALIDEVVVSGTGDQVASRLRAILAAGIDEILAMPVPVTDGEAEEAALLEILATIESV
jgi:alkanesulfonate monooxygenase SsuD/methylene tetrahydromethanopterin reductase-like flavin-dependent oxidoreductase (luciferase family)